MYENAEGNRGSGKSFRKGLSLMDLLKLFPDDAMAAEWFADQRWPDGKPICHLPRLRPS